MVTVTNTPAIKIPFSGNKSCHIPIGSIFCDAPLRELKEFPVGTNTFVMQQMSVSYEASQSADQMLSFVLVTTHQYQEQKYYLPLTPGLVINDGMLTGRTLQEVTIYHDGVYESMGIPGIIGPTISFRQRVANTTGFVGSANFYYAGYFTWFSTP